MVAFLRWRRNCALRPYFKQSRADFLHLIDVAAKVIDKDVITTTPDSSGNFTRIAVSGPVALNELVTTWRAYAAAGTGPRRVLWDMRRADWSAAASDFEMLDLRNAQADYGDAASRVFAFLFASQSETAIVETYQADLECICVPRFFHYEPDALAWLLESNR